MKKLSLKNLKLEGNDLLQREQLKTVFGGYGGYGGADDGGDGSCAFYTHRSGDGDPVGATHVTKKKAKDETRNGGHWCCEGCSTASWIEMNGDYMMLK